MEAVFLCLIEFGKGGESPSGTFQLGLDRRCWEKISTQVGVNGTKTRLGGLYTYILFSCTLSLHHRRATRAMMMMSAPLPLPWGVLRHCAARILLNLGGWQIPGGEIPPLPLSLHAQNCAPSAIHLGTASGSSGERTGEMHNGKRCAL